MIVSMMSLQETTEVSAYEHGVAQKQHQEQSHARLDDLVLGTHCVQAMQLDRSPD